MKPIFTAAAAVLTLAWPAHAQTDIRFTLDWKVQGVHSWFYMARDRGYFADEGLNVTIDQGEGSGATVTRIMSGTYDAGFGDINASIQNAATHPEQVPVMVYQIYNQPPFAVLAKADGPVGTIGDLEGHKVGAPAGSAATMLFPALVEAAGLDASQIEIVNVAPNLQEQMLLQGQVDASLVFNVTSYLNLIGMGQDPDTDTVFMGYGEAGLDIYSNGVMVSQELADTNPEAVMGLVRAINRALRDVMADPSSGAAAVKLVEPLLDEGLEEQRIRFAIDRLIASPESDRIGLGAVDAPRLDRNIDIIQDLYELPVRPDASAIYTDAFLPPRDDRGF